jgi:N-acetylglucosaminyldiphosphoundecaprenol N-acetyl-beta-D-mannosaminyltransferase
MTGLPTLDLMGLDVAAVDQEALVSHMFSELQEGRGGWVVTANLDFLRMYAKDPEIRALYEAADVRVADGMPLVWAARIQGGSLPGRVAGATLVDRLAEESAHRGRSLYLLGGVGGVAERAAGIWKARHPELRIAGFSEPWISQPPTEAELAELTASLADASPDVILAGFGSPKQEQVLQHLRQAFPRAWMVGVGGSFNFVAGRVRRAPLWMQDRGLEWIHRMAQEPRRLARRYLVHDLPFSAELFASALWRRATRGRSSSTKS